MRPPAPGGPPSAAARPVPCWRSASAPGATFAYYPDSGDPGARRRARRAVVAASAAAGHGIRDAGRAGRSGRCRPPGARRERRHRGLHLDDVHRPRHRRAPSARCAECCGRVAPCASSSTRSRRTSAPRAASGGSSRSGVRWRAAATSTATSPAWLPAPASTSTCRMPGSSAAARPSRGCGSCPAPRRRELTAGSAPDRPLGRACPGWSGVGADAEQHDRVERRPVGAPRRRAPAAGRARPSTGSSAAEARTSSGSSRIVRVLRPADALGEVAHGVRHDEHAPPTRRRRDRRARRPGPTPRAEVEVGEEHEVVCRARRRLRRVGDDRLEPAVAGDPRRGARSRRPGSGRPPPGEKSAADTVQPCSTSQRALRPSPAATSRARPGVSGVHSSRTHTLGPADQTRSAPAYRSSQSEASTVSRAHASERKSFSIDVDVHLVRLGVGDALPQPERR